MKLERKHAWILIAIAAWTVIIWARFIYALANDHTGRPTAFFVAHGILIVVNFGLAILLASWGYRVLKATRTS